MVKADELDRLSEALKGRYTVLQELGRGGMASVYLAQDLKHDRRVALKVLRPELALWSGAERFLQEITLTARLDHPHIIPLLDSGQTDGLVYYVMPYVEGESLRDRLQREKQLPLQDAIRIIREVGDALEYAHRLGVIHRDIKPENLLLSGGHVRVADFGIARALSAAGRSRITETGMMVGTPTYMSPEQASGDRDVDGRSDVYSLGCVAYELLAGQPPFTGATTEAVLARKSTEQVPRLRTVRPAVPEAVEEAISKALHRVPADRFASVEQFAAAVGTGAAASPSASPRVPRRALLFGGALLVVVVGWIGWLKWRDVGAATPRISSLVVLPLDNLTGDPEQEYFVDGMHEAITSALVQGNSWLRLPASLTSMVSLRGRLAEKGTRSVSPFS